MSIPRAVLAKYIREGDIFVETGTKWGDTCIRAVECGAQAFRTCEVDPLQFGIAYAHLKDAVPSVCAWWSARFGRSQDLLLEIREVGADVVLLDAHTDTESPIATELGLISQWRSKPRVILIDDIGLMEKCWRVPVDSIRASLKEMGYAIQFEDGTVPADIMVGARP